MYTVTKISAVYAFAIRINKMHKLTREPMESGFNLTLYDTYLLTENDSCEEYDNNACGNMI